MRPLVLIGIGCVHRVVLFRAHFTLRCARRWRQPRPLNIVEAVKHLCPPCDAADRAGQSHRTRTTPSSRTDVPGTPLTGDASTRVTVIGIARVLEGGAAAVAGTIDRE